MQIDENFSSYNSSKGMLASFIGFRDHLSRGFFLKINPDCIISNVYLYISDTNLDTQIDNGMKYQDFVDEIIRTVEKRFYYAKINQIQLKNIWSIEDIFQKLTEIKENYGIFNISAGPSPFIAASIFWILSKKNVKIAHVIELRNAQNNELENYNFELIYILPYLNYIFELDNYDRFILNEINERKNTTTEIYKDIIKNFSPREKVSMRTIQNRINKLVNLELIEKTQGKKNNLYINKHINKIVKDIKYLKT
ncbi:MAG: hypothetical protein ACP5JE_01600 [Thermoplasmata archaeon]|jgi:hypothetical protein